MRIAVSPLITHLIKSNRLTTETGKLWAEDADSFFAVLGDYCALWKYQRMGEKGEQEGKGNHKSLSSLEDTN